MKYYSSAAGYESSSSQEQFRKHGRNPNCGGSCPVCTNCRG